MGLADTNSTSTRRPAPRRSSVSGVLREHAADLGVIGVSLEEEVDEARARDLDLAIAGLQAAPPRALRPACGDSGARLGEAHGEIGREVAVLRVLACARPRRRRRARRAEPGFGQRDERLAQQVFDQGLQGGSAVWIKGSGSLPKARKRPNLLPADPHRSTSAIRAARAAILRAAARARESAAAGSVWGLEQKVGAKVIGPPGDQGAGRTETLTPSRRRCGRALRRPRLRKRSSRAVLRLGAQQGEPE